MNYVSDWIGVLCMEWQKQLNDFMIIGGLEVANPPIVVKYPPGIPVCHKYRLD